MAVSTNDWGSNVQESSPPTVHQPQRSRELFQKSRWQVQLKENRSWCHSGIFCGRRKAQPVLTEFVEINKSIEAQNCECNKLIEDFNNLLATFRDLLMHVAKPQDSPEIRDKIRETRRRCLELCISANEILMPQIRSDVADGIPVDSQQLVNLVCCTQLFLRELKKCYKLIQANPMDMTGFYERRPRASGVSVLDKLILFKLPPRDYQKEELQSILRDTEKTTTHLEEMKEFMPCESNDKVLIDINMQKWNKRTKKGVYKRAEDWFCYCGANLG